MFDPLLLQSELSQYREVGIIDKLKKWNTVGLWLNFILPICGLMALFWYLRVEYQNKKELYQEFVPPHLNKYSRHYKKSHEIEFF